MKKLYEFTIGGKDKKPLRKFIIARPNRRQQEDADTQYAIEMSQCVRKGILTKNMLAKKYADTGGLLSEEAARELSGMYHRMNELISEQTRLKTVKTQNKANKAKLDKLEEEMVNVRREIVDVEGANLSLFSQTAESRAQNKLIIWYATHLIMEEIEGEYEPFFDATTFEGKLEQYYEREDEEDNDEYMEVMQKAGTALVFWYFNQGNTQEQFDELLKEFLNEQSVKEAEEEEEESPKKDE